MLETIFIIFILALIGICFVYPAILIIKDELKSQINIPDEYLPYIKILEDIGYKKFSVTKGNYDKPCVHLQRGVNSVMLFYLMNTFCFLKAESSGKKVNWYDVVENLGEPTNLPAYRTR